MDVLSFSLASWRKDPEMRIEDAYKWLFHATRGGEHAVTSADGPRLWLDREWPTLTAPLPEEPSYVELRPDRTLVRLNLRPYRTAGGDREKLLEAFVRSAREFRAGTEDFLACWHGLGSVLGKGSRGALTSSEWRRLDHAAKADGYPAIEHSAHYLRARKPAYRVLTGKEMQALIKALPASKG